MARRVTSFDVAAAAGVSRTTVSFVLNGVQNQTIPDKTRAAVLDAAQRLGYTPSAAARALRAGSSQLVLVMGPTNQPSELMDAGMLELTHRLRSAGYATVIAMSAGDADNLDVLWQSVSPAAVVSMFDMPTRVRETIGAMNIPIIDALFHTTTSMPGDFELQVDVGRQQAEHVISRGATEVVFAHPQRESVDVDILEDRQRGVSEVTTRNGIRFEVCEVRENPEYAQELARSLEPLLRPVAGRRLAICTFNDLTAMAILHAAQSIDLHAPTDFSIIGVDDIAAAPYVSPPLTTVRFDIVHHIGAIASRVIHVLEGTPDDSRSTDGPLSMVIPRASV